MSTDCGSFSGLKTLCVVTGASRGFGKTIALELSRVFAPGSSLVLIGRNGTKLQQTRDEILAIYSELNVHVEPLDVSSLDFGDFERTLKSVAESSVFDMAVMVHNAGTLTIGDCTLKANQLLDPHSIRSYFDTNLTSAMTMNALFLKYITQEKFKRRTIINISSLAADKPFKTWSLYCTGKAARDMFFKTLALEEPSIRVLTYSPGPLKTDMGSQTHTITADVELRNMMQELHAKDGFLDCKTSVDKMISFLQKDTYTSGVRVDYFDEIP